METGQRVVLRATGPAFGSERTAEAVLDILGLKGVLRLQRWFEQMLANAGIAVGSEGISKAVYADGYVAILFDGKNYTVDIPAHCLRPPE